MQIHYNLLVGDKPVRAKLVLHTVPASTPLRPLSLALMPAPPDIPCPTGVTGPLCNRTASLADLGQRFGQGAVGFVNTIESVCGRNPADPPAGDTTSCTWPVMQAGTIVRVGAHMHLLGQSMQIVLNPGTPTQKTILNVPNYNFHYQKAYDLQTAHPGRARRHDSGDVHLRPDAAPGAADAAQPAAPLRDVGRRLVRRDVPRAGHDRSARQLTRERSAGRRASTPAPSRSDRFTRSSLSPGSVPDRPRSQSPAQQARITSATVTATSPRLVGGLPNWAGSPEMSTVRTFQSLRTTTDPFVGLERTLADIPRMVARPCSRPMAAK